ncbi:MAG: tRNA (cytidine/uridine-2'-O-)-methyltransferase [Pseudoalteromonas tetraodonis]|jgi:tRNA (cytidine/uridine-2'-O-)-methyltransferase
MLNIVLVNPEIPPNTGNVGRLCLATGSRLHLVRPLGFDIDAKQVRRAGLDYWEHVDLHLWDSFDELRAAALEESPHARFLMLSKKASKVYWDERFHDGDYLVFGRETKGLPEEMMAKNPDACLTIPMVEGSTRSINLATSVSAVLFEAIRQLAHSGA